MMEKIDPEVCGFFNLAQWLDLMKFKTNYIEEDLVRAFKVFDPNDDEFVNKNDLRLAF